MAVADPVRPARIRLCELCVTHVLPAQLMHLQQQCDFVLWDAQRGRDRFRAFAAALTIS